MALVELKILGCHCSANHPLNDQWITVLKGVLTLKMPIGIDYPFQKRINIVTSSLLNRREVSVPDRTMLIDECHATAQGNGSIKIGR